MADDLVEKAKDMLEVADEMRVAAVEVPLPMLRALVDDAYDLRLIKKLLSGLREK